MTTLWIFGKSNFIPNTRKRTNYAAYTFSRLLTYIWIQSFRIFSFIWKKQEEIAKFKMCRRCYVHVETLRNFLLWRTKNLSCGRQMRSGAERDIELKFQNLKWWLSSPWSKSMVQTFLTVPLLVKSRVPQKLECII